MSAITTVPTAPIAIKLIIHFIVKPPPSKISMSIPQWKLERKNARQITVGRHVIVLYFY